MLMKKFFTLIFFSLWMNATVSSQSLNNGYAFTDAAGNAYSTETITCNQAEDDGFGMVEIPSGLYIKNIDADEGTKVAVQANITKMDNGRVQLCFPVNCISYSSTGEQKMTETAEIAKGEVKNLQTEWLPEAEGTCTVVYTATVYSGFVKKGTFDITVNYQYGAAGISSTIVNPVKPQATYDLSGRRLAMGKRGLCIVRMPNGTMRKVVK